MNTSFILRNGRVIDPVNGVDEVRDLAVVDGRIAAAPPAEAEIIDVSGLVVAPGFIDLHVHLREPGQTYKEDIATGTLAAAVGGFTAVVAMPNTSPAVDGAEVMADVQQRIREKAYVRVLQTGALTKGRKGEVLTDAIALRDAGAAALTDDGICIQVAGLMLEALEKAKAAGLPVIEHCEDSSVCAGGAIHEGAVSRKLGVPGQKDLTEDLVVARDVLLARHVGWPIHIQHISTRGAVTIVRLAHSFGIPITAEATPHHFLLTHEACRTHGSNAKMNPPLREEADRQAVLDGLADGTICAIATDHAPHSPDDKSGGLCKASAGIVGLEAAVPLSLTGLYHTGVLSLTDLIAKFTAGPRQVLMRTDIGSLEIGANADITLLDPDVDHVLDVNTFHSKSRNCPYDGWECQGKAVGTIVGGKWAYRGC